MSDFVARLRENYQAVEARIAQACQRAGRLRADVTLVAVTKYANWEWVEALVDLGHRDLGENRPQQLVERAALLNDPATWHLVGHLQSNKAKSVLPFASWIHSIDSLKLLEFINRQSMELPLRPRLLLEVNVTGEATKYGFTPAEIRESWPAIVQCRQVDIVGLMTMAPASDDPEAARPAFRDLRNLRDELQARSPDGPHLHHLSMGMTGDFEVAIEEGATCIRIGSALFEGLA